METRGSSAEWMGWILVLLGALLAFAAGRQVANVLVAGDAWMPVPATVMRTRVASLNGATGTQGLPIRVMQEVVYFVGGRRYQAAVDLGRFEDRAAAVAATQAAERAGTSIQVWVNVNQPATPSRQPAQREASYGEIAVFGLLGLFAVPLGSSLIRSSAPRQSETSANARPEPMPSHS